MAHETKVVEIRDRMTMVVGLATRVEGGGLTRIDRLLRRAGYGDYPMVVLAKVNGGCREAHDDPYSWNDRTMLTAHIALQNNWDAYCDGALLDVRVLLGETATPCESEVP